MRHRGVRAFRLAACCLLLSGCLGHGHVLTEHEKVFQRVCGNHSCPAPEVSWPTFTITVDGRRHVAPEAVSLSRAHRVSVTVTPEKGSALTRYWVAETRTGACCGVTEAGPQEGHVLVEGGAVGPDHPLTFTWTPTIPGQRILMLGFFSTAPVEAYERDGYSGIPLGRFTVS